MTLMEDLDAARGSDPDAKNRLASYLGPFVHALLLAQVSTRIAAQNVVPLIADAVARLPGQPAAAWLEALVGQTRSVAASLALEPASSVEHPDESVAGTHARGLLSALRALPLPLRELSLLRLVERVGLAEIDAVLGGEAPLTAQLADSVRQAMGLLSPDAALADDEVGYLLEPLQSAPAAAVVRLENELEPLRFNEDLARAPAPVLDGGANEAANIGTDIRAVALAELDAAPKSGSVPRAPGLVLDTEPSDAANIGTDLRAVALRSAPAELAGDIRATAPLPPEGDAHDWRSEVHTAIAARANAQPTPPRSRPWVVRSMVLGSAALVLAALALTLAQRSVTRGYTMASVLVAGDDLIAGTRLDSSQLALRQVPDRFVSAAAVSPDDLASVLHHELALPMQKGDPLLWSHLTSARSSMKLSSQIAHHLRAYAVPVDRLSSVDGLLRPDDRVDVLVVLAKSRSVEAPLAMTLLQRVPVLAVGLVSAKSVAFPEGREPEYANVELGLLQQEAELVALSTETADVHLTLRHPLDETVDQAPTVAAPQLLDANRASALARRRQATVQLIRQPGVTVP